MTLNDDLLAPGRVAVITGAALGIGAATARPLLRAWHEALLLDRNEDALRTLPTIWAGGRTCGPRSATSRAPTT